MRAGYSTRMRFYRDIPDDTGIVWYQVPDDRPFIPFPTAFFDWDWEEANRPGQRAPGGSGLGEQIMADRTYPGRPLPQRTVFRGVFCGNREQWAFGEGLPIVPPVLLPDGFPPCCGPSQIPFPNIRDCPTLAKLATACQELYVNGNAGCFAYVAANIMPSAMLAFGLDNGITPTPGGMIATCPDWTIAVISGTTNAQQYALQAIYSINIVPFSTPNSNSYRTSNFYQNISTFWLNKVLQFATPGRPVLLVGHSFGGAVAALVSLRMADSPAIWSIYLVTFGSPKAGDNTFTGLLSRSVVAMLAIVNDGDPVPRIPPVVNDTIQTLLPNQAYTYWATWSFMPYALGMYNNGVLYPNPNQYLDFVTIAYILSQIVAGASIGAFQPHFIGEYITRLELNNCGGVAPAVGQNVLFLDGVEFAGGPFEKVPLWNDLSGQGNNAVQPTAFFQPNVNNPSAPAGEAPFVLFSSDSKMTVPTLHFAGAFSLVFTYEGEVMDFGENYALPAFENIVNCSDLVTNYGAGGTAVTVSTPPGYLIGTLVQTVVVLFSPTGAYVFFLNGQMFPVPFTAGLGDPTVPFNTPITITPGYSVQLHDNNRGLMTYLVAMWNRYFDPGDPSFPYLTTSLSFLPPILPPPPMYIIQDDFSGPLANLNGWHPVPVNTPANAWITRDGYFVMCGNHIFCQSNGLADQANIDTGVSDCEIACNLDIPPNFPYSAGIEFRYTDDLNLWVAVVQNTVGIATLYLVKVAGGPGVVVSSVPLSADPAGTTLTMTILLLGSAITCDLNTGESTGAADTFNVAATIHGIRLTRAGFYGVSFSQFTVQP